MLKIKIAICLVWFLILYFIAFFSVRDYYKEFPHFLGVEDTQWLAIAILWCPILLIF